MQKVMHANTRLCTSDFYFWSVACVMNKAQEDCCYNIQVEQIQNVI
jgi:hypothetical protein